MATSSRFVYQGLRGLMRNFSLDLPVSISQVHFTSLAVNGWPSCHLIPWRSGKVSSVPSSFHDQPVARSGTIDCRLFCGTSCLNITRLLKTPIIGRLTATVDSSSSDTLAGLSKWGTLRMPPCFWANAVPADNPSNRALAAVSTQRPRLIHPPPVHSTWHSKINAAQSSSRRRVAPTPETLSPLGRQGQVVQRDPIAPS